MVVPEGVTGIGDKAFGGNKTLVSVTFPASLTSIGSSAFFNCGKLASVTLPAPSPAGTAYYSARLSRN
ncbi:MAG: leucine-rich repeat domain-containing protein [Spirochaetaceae bacterium]|nr:leucine-rich repeat domain-containing protein [Spirochaetaceae bacterium]